MSETTEQPGGPEVQLPPGQVEKPGLPGQGDQPGAPGDDKGDAEGGEAGED